MYRLISNIAKRCHAAATKRGKDTSGLGCLQSLGVELSEYWKAVDNGKTIPDFVETVAKAIGLLDKDFNALYDTKIHNTVLDELADILIVAATWLQSTRLSEGENFKPERSTDVMMLCGALQFICGQITKPGEMEKLRIVVNLKMRYNETRND